MRVKNEQPNLNEIELNDLAPADKEMDETKGGAQIIAVVQSYRWIDKGGE